MLPILERIVDYLIGPKCALCQERTRRIGFGDYCACCSFSWCRHKMEAMGVEGNALES